MFPHDLFLLRNTSVSPYAFEDVYYLTLNFPCVCSITSTLGGVCWGYHISFTGVARFKLCQESPAPLDGIPSQEFQVNESKEPSDRKHYFASNSGFHLSLALEALLSQGQLSLWNNFWDLCQSY